MTEQQHNDTLANAINTGINSQSNINRTFRGEIGDNYFLADLRDDMDFYRFEGGGGDRIAWKVTADGMPWYLADLNFGSILYGSNGNILKNSTQNTSGSYAFILPNNDTYYIAVWGGHNRPFSGTFNDVNPNVFPRSIGNAVKTGTYTLSFELFDNTPNFPSTPVNPQPPLPPVNPGNHRSKLNTNMYRFHNQNRPGTYFFAGPDEAAYVRANIPSFREDGFAFQVAVSKTDPLMQGFYRFQNTAPGRDGTYLFAGEQEAAYIRANIPSFREEGLAFFAYSAGIGGGTMDFTRFQNALTPGTYLFTGPSETASVMSNPNFIREGFAFAAGG